jgi:hypothetical protein
MALHKGFPPSAEMINRTQTKRNQSMVKSERFKKESWKPGNVL